MKKSIVYAEKFRRKFNIDLYSPIDILSLAMEMLDNLTIIWMPMLNNVDGCCYKMEKDYIVFINSNQSIGTQNFILAHEIYHLLYQDEIQSIFCSSKNNNDEIEKEADEFADNLLMPNSALYSYMDNNNIKKWSLLNIIKCEQYFQIDHITLLDRLKKEKLIDNSEYNSFKVDIVKNAKKLGFSTELYLPSSDDKKYYSLGNLISLVEEVYDSGKIDKEKRNEILIDAFRGDYIFNMDNRESVL